VSDVCPYPVRGARRGCASSWGRSVLSTSLYRKVGGWLILGSGPK
jgi:hypothetical protein